MPQTISGTPRGAKRSLSRTYFRRFSAISVAVMLLLGVTWLVVSQQIYEADAARSREHLLGEKRRLIESRAREAVDFIQFMNARVTGRIREEIRDRVNQAHALITVLYEGYGPARKEEAEREIKAVLRSMRYAQDKGYFFAVGLDGTAQVIPPQPEIEGTDVTDLVDSSGRHFAQTALDIAHNEGNGYYEYSFFRPGSEKGEYSKISYLRRFDPLNWYIGTGLYVDDMRQEVQREVLRWLDSRNYADGGYIFAGGYDGVPVLGPFKGQNVIDVPDVNGVMIVRELIRAAKEGGGYVSYVLPTYGGVPAYPKLSFSLGVDDWGWYVGSGISTDAIEMELARMREAHLRSQARIMGGTAAAVALCLAALTLAMRSATRRMESDFASFKEFFAGAAEHGKPIDRETLQLIEYDELAAGANAMLEQRHRAEAALRESEARWRTIFETINDGYYRSDLDGTLRLANPAAIAMIGMKSLEDVVGLNIARDFYKNPDERDLFRELLLRHGKVEGFQTVLTRADGGEVVIEANSRLIYDEDGTTPVAVEGIVRDVTERKRTQELLVQTEKMMSVGGLAAGMAHEINNPLGGILQGVQNILRRLSPSLPANEEAARDCGTTLDTVLRYLDARRIRYMLEGIRESGERAARIVEGMLSFSRASESRRETCDLNALADRVVELASSDYDLSRRYDFRQIEMVREYDPALSHTSCTGTEIEQVLLNLLRNAAQAMADHGTSDGPPRIAIRTRAEDGWAVIEIEDNGPGMDEATRKRVFEPFYTTKPPGRGTGLGLSVAYFIVTQNHGGQFSVSSTPGKGTTFTVRLPL